MSLDSVNKILAEICSHNPNLSILTIGNDLIPPILNHVGKITIIGNSTVTLNNAYVYTKYKAKSTDDVITCLRDIIKNNEKFDIIYIDHDHRLKHLWDQIYFCLKLSHESTIFIFDDACPPEYTMATYEPRGGWWTGQVCYLRTLLKSNNSEFSLIETILCRPTGLLFSIGFLLPPKQVFDELLYAEPNSLEELNDITSPTTYELIKDKIICALQKSNERGFRNLISSDGVAEATELVILDNKKLIERTPPKFVTLAQNNKIDIEISQLYNNSRNTHEKVISTYENVSLYNKELFIKNNYLFTRYNNSTNSIADRTIKDNVGSIIQKSHNNNFMIQEDRENDVIRIEDSVFYGTPDEYMNYGMWLLLCVTSAYEFLKNKNKYKYFFCYQDMNWQKIILKICGLEADNIISHDIRKNYNFKKLTMIRHSFRDLVITNTDKIAFNALAEKIITKGSDFKENKKVFLSRLSRSKKGAYRSLLNEEELLNKIKKLGFDVVEPELLSFEEQIKLFRSASVIVGLGGAGMFNSVFCKEGTKIVSIESSNLFIDAHCNIFSSIGSDYGVIIGEEDLSDASKSQRRWTINVDKAIDSISEFI